MTAGSATVARSDPLLEPRVHVVHDVVAEIADVVTLRVAPVDGRPAPFLPAQIGMVGAFGIGEAAISISSSPSETRFHEYTIRRAGAITGALTSMAPGDQFWVRGPFGRPWDLEAGRRDVLIVAGGIGLAPLRSAIYAVAEQRRLYGRVVVAIGAQQSSALLYSGEYDSWRARGLDVSTIIDVDEPGWDGPVGFVPQLVAELEFDPLRTDVMMCGPDVMMRATASALVDRGVPAEQIQLTLERNMQCGNGLCGHCQLGGLLVCRDGPVVRYPLVAASLAVQEL